MESHFSSVFSQTQCIETSKYLTNLYQLIDYSHLGISTSKSQELFLFSPSKNFLILLCPEVNIV